MSIIRKAFKIFNGSVWDEYHLKTDSKQVIHTKADGTDTTVAEQLLALNSTSIKETGSSKGWIYRKWCDGTVELWWNSNVTYSNPVGAGVTGLTLASVDIPLPFTISNGMAVASATWYFSEWAQASINTKSATHVTVRKFGNVNSQNLPVQGVYIYVRGTI